MSGAELLDMARRVDWSTAVPLLAFWARWEFWARRHKREHVALQRLVPHEVTHG